MTPDDLDTEELVAMCESALVVKDIQFACDMLAEMEVMIPEEDLANTVISVNASKLADMIETFLAFVDVYEGDAVDVEEMIDFAGASVLGQTVRTDGKLH